MSTVMVRFGLVPQMWSAKQAANRLLHIHLHSALITLYKTS